MTRFTSHDVELRSVLNGLKAKPKESLTRQEQIDLDYLQKEAAAPDAIFTTHKMEYLRAGYDPVTGNKLPPDHTHANIPDAKTSHPDIPADQPPPLVPDIPNEETKKAMREPIPEIKKKRGNPNFGKNKAHKDYGIK